MYYEHKFSFVPVNQFINLVLYVKLSVYLISCISDVDVNMRSVIKEIIRDPQELNSMLHGNPYDESSTMSSLSFMQANSSMMLFNGTQDSNNSASSSIGK